MISTIFILRWSKIALPKNQGGLGIRKLELMNQACPTKLGWKLQSGKPTLWCNLMRSKYINQRQTNGDIGANSNDTVFKSTWLSYGLGWRLCLIGKWGTTLISRCGMMPRLI